MDETAPPFLHRSGADAPTRTRAVFWENILVLIVAHAAAVAGVVYALSGRSSPWSLALAAAWFALCMLSTTAGYHRLFAHRTYRAAFGLRLFYLAFGAAAGQASVLYWASDHRWHHARTDTEDDPHNIRKGFWWAHIGWLFYRGPPPDYDNVKDLQADPLVRFQNRWYLVLAVVVGFAVPVAISSLWGDPLGGLLLAGFLRLTVEYHATFSINSVAHTFGRQPYTREGSARDSFLAALLTFGEGYHNYHHRFPGDYRNGVRFHHFDPTKWWVWLLSKVGLTRDLKRAPPEAIRQVRDRVTAEGRPA